MKTNEVVNFIKKVSRQTVFVDVDGTILKSFKIPENVTGNKLVYWNENLTKTSIIFSRIAICIILKIVGCKLVIFTDRGENHKNITIDALGIFKNLFSDFQFYAGKKHNFYNPEMFLIDDNKKFVGKNTLTVEKI